MCFDYVIFVVFIAVCHHLLLFISSLLLPVCFYGVDCCLSLFVCGLACLSVLVVVLFAMLLKVLFCIVYVLFSVMVFALLLSLCVLPLFAFFVVIDV